MRTITHETVLIERAFEATSVQIFAAYANLEVRKRWAVPSGYELEFLQADFTVSGLDVFRFGENCNLHFKGNTRYEEIVPDQLIVFSENIYHVDVLYFVSLNTLELVADGAKCNLYLTLQIASFQGLGMIKDTHQGWIAMLDNLAIELEN